ncbi:carnitinyl-CoA dehydratase [Dactylonectria estremocensis]|uniref:Carnitinyl-CoA dehydratase n=1 Tax=Dactylonectria estremocensis TaxID=1079267 RepID=A0A9P9DUM8_9HYPO|nr:carnitinyl-CoA dehydratase [Dactylonectria estremocensis]
MTPPSKETEQVLVQTTPEGITTIALNRPHRRNAVDGPTARKLWLAFLSFENDSTQKVCVFHGNGGTFCAGFDLQEFAKLADRGAQYSGPNIADRVAGRNLGPCGPTRLMIQKPVICAVSGYAVAGGLELSLLGDIRVAEEDSVFGLFSRRFGVPMIDAGSIRLPSIVGLGRALDIVLTGRPVPAQEALSMGLANRIVPKGKAFEEAMSIARDLVKYPQGCLNADRYSCYYAAWESKSFGDALSQEFNRGVKVIESESIEGASRFSAGEGRHGAFNRSKL